ncbi:MAG: hypothetical protein AAFX81_01625 [Pseudomonadota bacterium]
MSFTRWLLGVLLVLLLGVTLFLVTWDIPPPVERIERVIPDDRFPR